MQYRRCLAALLSVFLLGSARATPLHQAAESGDLAKVRELLDSHPDWVNLVDEEGETALLEAAEEGHAEVVGLLLERGASLNHQDEEGETALMEAAEESQLECVKLLLGKGAALGLLEQDGRNAFQLTKDEAIRALLRSRGAR